MNSCPLQRRKTSFLIGLAVFAACAEAQPPASQGLRITEVVVDGSPYDWIEVVNAGDAPVDLVDYLYVDGAGDPDRARPFPDLRLAPGQRHVQPVDRARSSFALDDDDAIWLLRARDGATVDGVEWQPGDIPPGGALVRLDDTGDFVSTATPTPDHPTPVR